MFTGIIENLGTIERIEDHIITLSHTGHFGFSVGDSLAVSGACMTLLSCDTQRVSFHVMQESWDLTLFQHLRVGDMVNLEPSARIGDRNSGHFVTGHIDVLGRLTRVEKTHDFWTLRVEFPAKYSHLVVQKGSIALDGVSLTISNLSPPEAPESWIEVCLLPFTWEHTTFSRKKRLDWVNIEFDILGKYIHRKAL